jgi:hypothetical protein
MTSVADWEDSSSDDCNSGSSSSSVVSCCTTTTVAVGMWNLYGSCSIPNSSSYGYDTIKINYCIY